jgi:hypothetical protein
MIAAGEPPQHLPSLGLVARLAENGVLEEDERVGREHPLAGVARRADGGLPGGQARRSGAPGLSRLDTLIDVGGSDAERDAQSGEDLGAARGGGGEDETGYHPVILRPIFFLSFRGAKRRGHRAPSADVSLRTAAERDKRRRRDGAHLGADERPDPSLRSG